jgi:hypothetical protein
MTTLLEQAAADEGGWTVSPVMQLKNLQMAQILYKGQPARIQVVPRGDMSLRIPFAPSVYRGTGEETRVSCTFDAPQSVVDNMERLEKMIIAMAREQVPHIDALWVSCARQTPHGPQLRCKLNTDGLRKIQLVNEALEPLDLPVAELQHRQAVPILAVRGVCVQRNQVGLMLDLAACIVGPKEEREAMQIDFL